MLQLFFFLIIIRECECECARACVVCVCVCGHGFGMLCQEGGANGCLGGVMDKSLIALEVVL